MADRLIIELEGIPYPIQVGIGAGAVKDLAKFDEGCRSTAEETAFGSITELLSPGNQGGDTFYYDDATGSSVNSIGLANQGYKWFAKQVRALVERARNYGKKARISLSGKADEIFRMVARLVGALEKCDGFDWVVIEINLACPNIPGKPVIAYDPLTVAHIVSGVYLLVGGRSVVAFKLAPYDKLKSDELGARFRIRRLFCELTPGYPGRVELVLCNTYGKHRMLRPDGSPALGVTEGLGGLGGAGLYPYTLDNVAFFAGDDLPGNITLVGMGGLWDKDAGVIRERVSGLLLAARGRMEKILVTTAVCQFGTRVIDEVYAALADFALAEAA